MRLESRNMPALALLAACLVWAGLARCSPCQEAAEERGARPDALLCSQRWAAPELPKNWGCPGQLQQAHAPRQLACVAQQPRWRV